MALALTEHVRARGPGESGAGRRRWTSAWLVGAGGWACGDIDEAFEPLGDQLRLARLGLELSELCGSPLPFFPLRFRCLFVLLFHCAKVPHHGHPS